MLPLNLAAVRAAFPALAGDWAFLDNAGGSQVLRTAAERMADYMLTTSVQTGASYAVSEHATARMTEARAAVARLVNAARPEEVVFGPSTTVLMRFLATAMASQFEPGDEVILTEFDHESNIGPWHGLESRSVTFKTWPVNRDDHAIDLDALDALLTERTRLVCVTHCSNILGTINPVRQIADRVHAAGARLCVDAVAYAPHRAVDVQAFAADFYLFSFYKTFGPHFAMLYGRHDHLLGLDGLYHYFYGRERVPHKLEPGNVSYEAAWSCTAIVDYLEGLGGGTGTRAALEAGFEAVAEQEERLSARLLDWLDTRNDLVVVGSRKPDRATRVPTIAFKPVSGEADALVRRVDAARVGIRHGDFHSRRLVEALGLADRGGVLRASMVHYNTVEEVDRLIGALEGAL